MSDPGPAYPRLTPPTPESPRLFISYGWTRDEMHRTFESDLWVDAFAGWLFGRGYNIWFDRKPRNFETGLNWFQVLTRMNDCNYFVPIITDPYVDRVTSASGAGPLVAEWRHAQKLLPYFLTFIGIRRSDAELPGTHFGFQHGRCAQRPHALEPSARGVSRCGSWRTWHSATAPSP